MKPINIKFIFRILLVSLVFVAFIVPKVKVCPIKGGEIRKTNIHKPFSLKRVLIFGKENDQVISVIDGIVTVNDNKTNKIIVESNNLRFFYYGVKSNIKVGKKGRKFDVLGILDKGKVLLLSINKNEKYLNVRKYIDCECGD